MATDHTDDDDDAEHREIESNKNIEAHTLENPKTKTSNNIKGWEFRISVYGGWEVDRGGGGFRKISNKKNCCSPYDKQHNKRRRGIKLYRVLA